MFCGLGIALQSYSLKSHNAVKIFRSELHQIKVSLQNGKLKTSQAIVLLSAIQARENEVIIEQNQIMINQQKKLLQLSKGKLNE
jgi:hypothetical protein